MDTDVTSERVQHTRLSSFSVREQQHYRAEVSLIAVLECKGARVRQCGVSDSAGSLCLAEDAHAAVYAHEGAA